MLLLYGCLKPWYGSRASCFAAAIFAVHPLQAWAVNSIAARGFLLAALFGLAALWSWLKSRSAVERPASRFAFRVMTLFCLAALVWANPEWTLHAAPGVHSAQFWLAQSVVAARYLRLLVIPRGFTVDPDIPAPSAVLACAAALVWLLGIGALWRWRGTHPSIRWILAGLVLMIPGALFPARGPAADDRMYIPMIGFCAAAGILLARIKPPVLAIAVLVLLTAAGASRTWVWLSEERLWREALRHAPGEVRPRIQLALQVRATEALELLNQAAQLEPHNPEIPAHTGKVLLDEQQYDAALTELSRSLALDPRNAVALNNRGVALAALNQTAAARLDFEQALEIDPGLAEARENLSKLPAR